jgi:hypothetical protein
MILFLKNLLFTVLIPGTVGVYLLLWLSGGWRAAPAWAWLLAAPLLLAGAFLYFWCLWNFAVTGRGTPAPIDPPKKLIIRGPHRYVRNPMYLGVLTVVAGWTVLFRSMEILRYAAARRTPVPPRRPRHRGAFAEAAVRRRVRGVLPDGSQVDSNAPALLSTSSTWNWQRIFPGTAGVSPAFSRHRAAGPALSAGEHECRRSRRFLRTSRRGRQRSQGRADESGLLGQ